MLGNQNRPYSWDYSWKNKNDIYLLRNNRWYRDDYLEVNHHDIELIREQMKTTSDAIQSYKKIVLTDDERKRYKIIDTSAFIVKNLNPFKIINGLRYYVDESRYSKKETINSSQEFSHLAQIAFTYPKTLLFFEKLSIDEKIQLLKNNLIFSDLSKEKQTLLIQAYPIFQIIDSKDTLQINFETLPCAQNSSADFFGNVYNGSLPFKIRISPQVSKPKE